MSHLNDLWSVMVIYFPSARGEVERSIEVNRPEMVLRCDGVSLQSLRESHRHYITLSFLLNHLYRCHHSSDPNLRSFCGINGCTKTNRKCLSETISLHPGITKHGDLLKAEQNEGNVEEINNNSSGSDMDGEINEDDDFAPLPPIDFQRESEEIRRTGALHLLRMKDKDRVYAIRIKLTHFPKVSYFNSSTRVEVTPPKWLSK